MAKLPKYTLSRDKKNGDWRLEQEGADRAKKIFETKGDATAGGVLRKALGAEGGSVRIKKTDGTYQEERTYPKSKDPKSSPG